MSSVPTSEKARFAVGFFSRFLIPYWYQGLVVLFCILFVTVGSLAAPYILKVTIDEILPAKRFYPLLVALAILLSITAVRLVLSFISDYLYAWASNRIVRNIRVELFQHLMYLPLRFHDRQKVGELVFRLNSDVGVIQSVLTASVLRFLHSVLILIGLVAVLCYLNATLFLLCSVVIPLFVVNLLYFQPKIRKVVESIQQQGAGLSSYAIERFSHVSLIQLSNSDGHETGRFRSALNDLIASVMRNVLYSISMGTVSSGLVAVTPVFILGWGGYHVMQGVMTLGTLIAFLQYTTRLFNPVQSLHKLYMDLVRGLVSMRRVLEFMQLPTQEATHTGRKPFVYDRTIEFQDVHFSFDDQPVLQGINLKLAKGKSYALVGASGSGKTTLANMLCAFYQPDQGRIIIDGVPLEDIQLREVRAHIGVVSQQVHLFDDTIWNNICYGNFEREPAEIERVIEQMGLNGLDVRATIGEQGVQLSGGQKQRIALARTLLQPVDLLILDEATAALDAESEATLFRRVQQLYRDQTILLISHRLSAVQGVDEVICLADGRVVEQGPPEVLRQRGGYYAQFVQHQQEAALELTG